MLGSRPDQSDLGSPPVQGEKSFSPTWVMPPIMGVGGIQGVAMVVAPVEEPAGGEVPVGVELMLEEELISSGSLDQSARVWSEISDNGDPKTLGGVGRDGVAEVILRQAQMRCGWEGSTDVSEGSSNHVRV